MAACGLAAATVLACSDDSDGDGGGSGGSNDNPSSSGTGPTGSTSGSVSSTSASTGGNFEKWSLIDDMEDRDNAIVTAEGRKGYWYSFDDGTGTQNPKVVGPFVMQELPTPRGTSISAVHTDGSGFTDFVGIGFDLNVNAETTKEEPYDASGYTGITFWAKKAPGSAGSVRFGIPDGNTDEVGSLCTKCFDHFGTNLELTEEWAEYNITFAELRQNGFGEPQLAALATAQIYGVQFQVVPATGEFDFWVDDIAFTK